MNDFLQDIRLAARQLIRARGATLIIILTLALGIGANSSVFTMLNATLFKSLNVPDADRLVWIAERNVQGGHFRNLSYPNYLGYRDRATAFSGVLAYSNVSLAMGGETAERVNGLMVSANFFDVLELKPSLGRGFLTSEDSAPGAHAVVVLSDALWRRRFGASASVINSVTVINGHQFTVVGIAPPGFRGLGLGEPSDLFLPISMRAVALPNDAVHLDDPGTGWLATMARLKPGVTVAAANAEVGTIGPQLRTELANRENAITAEALPLRGGLNPSNRSEIAPVLSLLMVVPLLVLVVACANVASLLLARAIARRKELAVRRAIGASRGRVIRQLLTEALVLAMVSGLAGALLAVWMTALIVRVGNVPAEIAQLLVPDARVLAFTIALALGTVVLFGLLPALSATTTEMSPALKNEGATLSLGRRRHRLRDAFVVAQVAVSLLLLITAGLFLRSLNKAVQVNPGFDSSHLATVSFDVGLQGYSAERTVAFYRQLRQEVEAMPGVASSALATAIPLSGRNFGNDIMLEGTTEDSRHDQVSISTIYPGFFQTMGIGIVSGREFAATDVAGAPQVAVINQAMARQLWPGADPLGKRFRFPGKDQALWTVVGVARDGKYGDLTESARPFVWLPLPQDGEFGTSITLVVRTTGDVGPLMPSLPKLFTRLDHDLPLERVATYADLLHDRVDKQQAASAALGVFGLLALLLAALGLYGVTTNGVAARTREIGIRMSLGARRENVLALFVREGVELTLIGVAIGLVMSAAVSKLLAGFLFGLTATDGLTFASGAIVLCVVAAVASYLPARRATRVDPMTALRSE